ncbi:hypothetical protein [Aeromonas sp. R2-2]|uniref:hypothetical protein n=1 Tax=Aeromonas sp. R2-2 TaxID=3138460 RepID=UPI0034A55A06
MPNKNGEWWNGGWQRRGKSEWNLENESVFRENDDISVSLVQKLRGFWVDGEPPKKQCGSSIKLSANNYARGNKIL